MGLFTEKKEDTKAKAPKAPSKVKSKKEKGAKNTVTEDLTWVIIKPRITEKAAFLGGQNIYTFDINPRANKIQIADAIKVRYGVTPEKVRVLRIQRKSVTVRGRKGMKSLKKKAYVHLKKGDSIALA